MQATTLLDKTDRLPPFMTFALARDGRKSPQPAVLAKKAGLSLRTFERIAGMLTWDSVKLGVASRFSAACGVDLLKPSRQFQYMRKAAKRGTVFSHLQPYQRQILARKIEQLKAISHGPGIAVGSNGTHRR